MAPGVKGGLAAVLAAGILGGLAGSLHAWPTFAAGQTVQPITGAATEVTVTGTGTLSVTPTGAQVSVGYQDNGRTAGGALARNNAVMTRIIAAVEALKIPAKDLQTSGFSIDPNYGNGSSPTITGYQVTNGVTVTINGLALVGPVLDAATAAGANQVNGVNFTGGNGVYPALYAAAMHNAAAQAAAIAAPLHERVGPVVSVSVQNTSGIQPVFGLAMAKVAAPTPILSGQNQVSVTLQVVYKLER
jgi:uncharacterized protein YggE